MAPKNTRKGAMKASKGGEEVYSKGETEADGKS
jgi:hypothetical protein